MKKITVVIAWAVVGTLAAVVIQKTWYLWQACTISDTAMWLSALEHDKYVKINGRWWQTEMILDPFFVAPYEDGWHKPDGAVA